jgi:hypothetical protein
MQVPEVSVRLVAPPGNGRKSPAAIEIEVRVPVILVWTGVVAGAGHINPAFVLEDGIEVGECHA